MADTKRDREAEKKAREKKWWDGWWEADYSWDGLAKLDSDGTPNKPWLGWSVTPDGICVESSGAPEGSRDATRQDYYRWDANNRRLRTDKDLLAKGLLVETEGQPDFHILHLPATWHDVSESWKDDLDAEEWNALETEATRLVTQGAATSFDRGDIQGADYRTQMQGVVLRGFPRPPSSSEMATNKEGEPQLPSLHLIAFFAAFLADCRANKLEFASSADFARCGFFADANFRDAQFSGGYASFRGAVFGGDAYFSNAQFSGGYASFWDAQFSGGDASFSNAQFSGGYASFSNAQFSGGYAYFRGAVFGGDANFSNAQFSGGYASFWDAQFSGGDASFSNAQFSGGDASFSNAQFSGGYASFRGAVFGGLVRDPKFVGPHLPAKTNEPFETFFDGACFEDGFLAVSVEFLGAVSFRGTRFEAAALFGDAQQSGSLGTKVEPGAHFRQSTSFRGAQFKALADFARCRFPERADHRNSAFEGARFFESLDFKGVERLPFSAFQGALLDKGLLIGPEHPVEEQFIDGLNDAAEAVARDHEITNKPDYDKDCDADIESRFGDARFAALEAGCRVLKHAMAQISDRQREQKFFTMEMRARSRRDTTLSASRLLTWFYGRCADYGGAVFRPLRYSALLAAAFGIAFFAFTYLFGCFFVPELVEDFTIGWGLPVHPAVVDALSLASKNMLGPLGHLFGDTAPFAYAGEAPRFWFNCVLGVLSMLQTIPSLILLFLSGLALRRQFQIS